MAESPSLSEPILHGRYRIEERLGATRLTAVYRAYDERLERRVLVHLLRKELLHQASLRQRFIAEAQQGARRAHPSLLRIYDSGEVAGRPFMITEYVAGRTLREIGPIAIEEALLYFRQIVGAIAACQAAGAPHPPISSANVVLVGDGHVELVENWTMTPAELGADAACYRAPERTAGHPATAASAVYSLGLLLIEMISGRQVFTGTDAAAIARAHMSSMPPALADIQPQLFMPSLARLIARSVTYDPSRRFADAAALGQALDDLRRAISGDTDRLASPPLRAPPAAQSAGAPPAGQPAPVHQIAPPRAPTTTGPDVDRRPVRGAQRRSPITLMTMLALFIAVGGGAYLLASLAFEGLTSIRLPRPDIPAPTGLSLPGWLTGVAEGPGEVLVVTIGDVEGLNLRDGPGLGSQVIGLLPNGARVRKLDGPRIVDDVPWVLVRSELNGRQVEGWVSQYYVRAE